MPTRLPEAFRGRHVGVVDELNETQKAHAARDEPIDPNAERDQQTLARRALREYGEQSDADPGDDAAYLPVSSLASEHVLALPATASLPDGLTTMDSGSVHHLVITAEGHVAGLVDQRWVLETLRSYSGDERLATFQSIELPPFLTATPETDAHQLARLMLAHQLDAALVIGSNGEASGLVTATDFLRRYAQASEQEGDA
ncbi:CBS domain-containing protein [Tamilnaduibacter salinus]|uniref:CBS domain-containing protein n=1 Tax=Tamilnaduibacter salinus TaxID=1484056 RepID=UPI001D17CA32|nr:CBS domain-containing protein [Tamilnaduibacter salinus]